jgi:hypothetical protein
MAEGVGEDVAGFGFGGCGKEGEVCGWLVWLWEEWEGRGDYGQGRGC